MSNTREINTIKTQFGVSSTADFEEDTWTFKMNNEYKVVAGEFALVDKILYDQLILSIKELTSHCEELKMQSIYLSNTSVTLKRLEGLI